MVTAAAWRKPLMSPLQSVTLKCARASAGGCTHSRAPSGPLAAAAGSDERRPSFTLRRYRKSAALTRRRWSSLRVWTCKSDAAGASHTHLRARILTLC